MVECGTTEAVERIAASTLAAVSETHPLAAACSVGSEPRGDIKLARGGGAAMRTAPTGATHVVTTTSACWLLLARGPLAPLAAASEPHRTHSNS